MFKKTFVRLILLGTLVFASLLVLVSAKKAQSPLNSDCPEPAAESEIVHPQGEFILETLAGSTLFWN